MYCGKIKLSNKKNLQFTFNLITNHGFITEFSKGSHNLQILKTDSCNPNGVVEKSIRKVRIPSHQFCIL